VNYFSSHFQQKKQLKMDPNQLVSKHFEKSLKALTFESWELKYLDLLEDMLACY